ncbi:MAG: hypothetical protein R3F22_10370 [Lysobacteraceae bacterium]
MKTGIIVTGVLLLIIGALIAMGAISFPDSKEVLSIGDNSLSVETQKKPSNVLGYVLLGIGGLVTVVGATRKR